VQGPGSAPTESQLYPVTRHSPKMESSGLTSGALRLEHSLQLEVGHSPLATKSFIEQERREGPTADMRAVYCLLLGARCIGQHRGETAHA